MFSSSKKLKKLALKSQNIKFKEPIFGEDKIKTLKSSWCNILLSDSEVLSLSVLESASLKLPSLVNARNNMINVGIVKLKM